MEEAGLAAAAALAAIYILQPLCEAQTFNGTFPQLEIYWGHQKKSRIKPKF